MKIKDIAKGRSKAPRARAKVRGYARRDDVSRMVPPAPQSRGGGTFRDVERREGGSREARVVRKSEGMRAGKRGGRRGRGVLRLRRV